MMRRRKNAAMPLKSMPRFDSYRNNLNAIIMAFKFGWLLWPGVTKIGQNQKK